MYGYNNPYLQSFNQNQPSFNQAQPQTPQDERVWVSNQQAAESYLLAPSGFVRLWDSSTSRFYEKRADATGRPLPMDIYEYKRIMPENNVSNIEPIKIPMDEINARFEDITGRIEALEKAKKVVKNAKQSNVDDPEI